MKKKKNNKPFLILINILFVLGFIFIIPSFIFYKKDKGSDILIMLFCIGSVLIIFYLISMFFISKCRHCGKVEMIKNLFLEEEEHYCKECGAQYYKKEISNTKPLNKPEQ